MSQLLDECDDDWRGEQRAVRIFSTINAEPRRHPMNAYAKAIAAFFTALGTWGSTCLADGRMDGAEWFGLCGVVVVTVGVWAIPNTKPARRR
jgi:hypothetical protein